jgi:hypothetical protein
MPRRDEPFSSDQSEGFVLDGSVMEAMPAIIMAKSGVGAIGPAGVADGAIAETAGADVLTLTQSTNRPAACRIPSDCLKR